MNTINNTKQARPTNSNKEQGCLAQAKPTNYSNTKQCCLAQARSTNSNKVFSTSEAY